VRCYFNVTVGQDLSHDELLATHHAVLYAVGASDSRDLGIPGEDLPGNHAAATFVAWYNGHPDYRETDFDLSTHRAVIIGNGNVALDVARVLVVKHATLATTDIADHALNALQQSLIQEVVVLGRRGVGAAAFSVGEFLALGKLDGVDIVIAGDLGERPEDFDGALKYDIAQEYAARPTTPGNKRIVFRFSTAPAAIVGQDRVGGLAVISPDSAADVIDTGLLLRSIGYRGTPVDGLPFDAGAGVIPNDYGRVVSGGEPRPGVYVCGWIKRGPRGVIGTNKACAQETVAQLLGDFDAGLLRCETTSNSVLDEMLAGREVHHIDWTGWLAIDAAERRLGEQERRPRVKFVDVAELVDAAQR
jgi:ferredoxin--NADP+ reductase